MPFFFNINDKKIYSIIIIRRGSLKKTARLWKRSLTFSNIFKSVRLTIANKRVKPLNSQDLISNSPCCLPNDSHYVNLENLVSDQSSHINWQTVRRITHEILGVKELRPSTTTLFGQTPWKLSYLYFRSFHYFLSKNRIY